MTENGVGKFFPKQMNITERRLSGFCTNEVGFLLDLNGIASNIPKSAVIGNPLRYISFDDNSGNKLLNFTGSASSIDQNCNGKYLSIIAGSNFCIFDLHKGAILREFHEHDGPILSIAWHRTSPWLLASVGMDSTLRLWDLRLHPAQLQMRRTARPFTCLEYSPDCNYIACGGQFISVFDLNMTQSVQYMPCNSPATNIRFNPAECLLATSHEDQTVRFWDIDTGECVTQSPSFELIVGQICFPPDGKYLIVNIGTKICSIGWEPYELLSQVLFPFRGHFPINTSLQFPNDLNEFTPLTHLDIKVQNNLMFGLSIVNEDSDKIGTVCLSTISLDKFENYLTVESPILDSVEYLPSNSIPPLCPSSTFEINNIYNEGNEFEFQKKIDVTQLTDVALENILTTDIPELTEKKQIGENSIKSVEASPSRACHQKRPTALEGLSGNISTSFESGGGVCHSSSASTRSSSFDLRSPTTLNTRKITSKIIPKVNQQLKEDRKTEFRVNNVSGKRPNRLPVLNHNQQHHSNSFSCHNGEKPSDFTQKQLFRRGSSLNDVSDPINSNNYNNMPTSSSTTLKNRSKSQAQKGRTSKFSTSSAIIGNNRQKSESDSDDELDEFLQQDPKIRAKVMKRTNDIKASLSRSNGVDGNTLEFLVKETFRVEDPLAFAFLLDQYMERKRFSMSLNELFLSRVDSLLVHKNKECVQLGLNFLNMVTSRFGNAIIHGLASQEFTIGVDVEAEKRFERCTACRNALFTIQLKTSFYTDHMNSTQLRLFRNEILPLIDQIVSTVKSAEVLPLNLP
uniref:Katanin p80 subunit C-terminal domain-containing protein n=1 Tax=Meloidogyne incognita TaxID=6306 RepID=A0A914LEK1_MELIC